MTAGVAEIEKKMAAPDFWNDRESAEKLVSRLKEFNKFMDKAEEELPPCSREDLWQKDDEWAVMRQGRKSALKLYDNPEDAEARVKEEGELLHWVDHRPGKVNRCNYCNVNKWCSQFKELEEKGIIAE